MRTGLDYFRGEGIYFKSFRKLLALKVSRLCHYTDIIRVEHDHRNIYEASIAILTQSNNFISQLVQPLFLAKWL